MVDVIGGSTGDEVVVSRWGQIHPHSVDLRLSHRGRKTLDASKGGKGLHELKSSHSLILALLKIGARGIKACPIRSRTEGGRGSGSVEVAGENRSGLIL